MAKNNFSNLFAKVIGVNTANNEKLSGGLAALNYILGKNFQGVNYLAVDRWEVKNLDGCKAIHKFRLLNSDDEKILTEDLRGADLIFIIADEVWENITLTALVAHCAKKAGASVIFIAGGNFEDAEDEIIFDELINLPSENLELDAYKAIRDFIAN